MNEPTYQVKRCGTCKNRKSTGCEVKDGFCTVKKRSIRLTSCYWLNGPCKAFKWAKWCLEKSKPMGMSF